MTPQEPKLLTGLDVMFDEDLAVVLNEMRLCIHQLEQEREAPQALIAANQARRELLHPDLLCGRCGKQARECACGQ